MTNRDWPGRAVGSGPRCVASRCTHRADQSHASGAARARSGPPPVPPAGGNGPPAAFPRRIPRGRAGRCRRRRKVAADGSRQLAGRGGRKCRRGQAVLFAATPAGPTPVWIRGVESETWWTCRRDQPVIVQVSDGSARVRPPRPGPDAPRPAGPGRPWPALNRSFPARRGYRGVARAAAVTPLDTIRDRSGGSGDSPGWAASDRVHARLDARIGLWSRSSPGPPAHRGIRVGLEAPRGLRAGVTAVANELTDGDYSVPARGPGLAALLHSPAGAPNAGVLAGPRAVRCSVAPAAPAAAGCGTTPRCTFCSRSDDPSGPSG